MSTSSPKHQLSKVAIQRIGVCERPAVPQARFVLMKSATIPNDPQESVEPSQVIAWLEKNNPAMAEQLKQSQQQEALTMELKDMKLEDLAKARPDLVEAIRKTGAAEKPPGDEPVFVTKAQLTEIVQDLTDAIENVEKSVKDASDKISKADSGAAITEQKAAMTALQATVTDLSAKVEALSKSKSTQVAPDGEGKDVKKNDSKFRGVFSVVEGAQGG